MAIDNNVPSPPPNYIVTISSGRKVFCDTENEVWDAIGRRYIWEGYIVTSPTDKDIEQFIPF